MTFLIVLALGLQGPSLAYASGVTPKTMPPCAGYTLGDHDNCPCCPLGSAPALCCSGGIVFTGFPSAPLIPVVVPFYRMPAASGFAAFATERPTPLLRPPIG